MPLIEIPGKGLVEFPDDMSPQDITAAVQRLAGSPPIEERPPGPGTPAAPKPSFFQALGASAKERLGELGQLPRDLAHFGGDVMRVGSAMVPGPLGGLTAAGGSLAGDVLQGESPDLGRAAIAGGTTLALGGLGKLLAPLGKLRVAGTGKAADAALAAKAVRGANTPLQPGAAVEDLADVMRGGRGASTLGAAKAGQEAAIARQLPGTPAPVDTSTRAYLDAAVAGRAPAPVTPPALSREGYEASTGELTKLGRQGFGLRGEARNSPAAIAAREQYGELLAKLKADLEAQGGPALLKQAEQARRDFSGGTELRRLFRPNTGEGPDRVFRPGGFNLQDLQERAVKRLPELQGRLGQPSADEFLQALLRGGRPGQGTDRPLALSSSKFGGFRIPTGLQILAGPTDARLWQMLMQGAGAGITPGLLEALQGRP